jgi:hypothetical protein
MDFAPLNALLKTARIDACSPSGSTGSTNEVGKPSSDAPALGYFTFSRLTQCRAESLHSLSKPQTPPLNFDGLQDPEPLYDDLLQVRACERSNKRLEFGFGIAPPY